MSLRSIRATSARYRCALFLRLQLPLVRSDEGANIVRHIEELEPLLFVEGHRKAAHAVDRDGSLLAHLEAKAGGRALLQRGIFPAQAFQFGFDLFVGHGVPAVLAMDDLASTPTVQGRNGQAEFGAGMGFAALNP